MAPIRTIVVVPNPYSGIAPDGVPQGVVTMPGTRNYIGAHFDLVACAGTGKSRFYYAAPQEGETGVQGLRKVTVPFTPEIARAVLEGGLLVADKEHARMCGLSEDDYVDADAQLTAEREKALAHWQAHYGPDAKLGDVPVEATKPADTVTPGAPAPPVDPRTVPVLKGTPLAGPATNPSLVIRPAPEGA
jgi:hypothetical protein